MKIKFKPVNLRRTDDETIEKISDVRGIPIERVREMMKHACWTR